MFMVLCETVVLAIAGFITYKFRRTFSATKLSMIIVFFLIFAIFSILGFSSLSYIDGKDQATTQSSHSNALGSRIKQLRKNLGFLP